MDPPAYFSSSYSLEPFPFDRMLLPVQEAVLRSFKQALATASFLSSLVCKLPPTQQGTPAWDNTACLVP